MALLVRAPMLAVLGALATCLALFERSNIPHVLFLAPIFAAGLALCTYEREFREHWAALLFVMVIALLCAARISCSLTQPLPSPHTVQTEGTVTDVRPWNRTYVAVLDTKEGRFLLQLPFATVTEGMRLAVSGITRPLRPARGGFDEERYWRARGVVSWLSTLDMKPLPSTWSLHRARYALSRALVIYMPELTGAYLRAAWTGQRAPSLAKAHRAWGTSHLLAVSGFHVGIVVLCVSLALGRGHILMSSLLLWGYILLTGAAPSSLRAGLMFQAALLARLFGRPSSSVNSVCLAAVLLLFHSPFLFWDVGWRLSVLAALSLTALSGAEEKMSGKWLLASPAISLVSFPQAAYTFGTFPLAGFLLNIFAPAFFAAAFSLASAAAVLRLLNIPFAPWLLRVVEGGFRLWETMADWLASFIPAKIPWGAFPAWLGAGVFFLLLCRFLRLTARRSAVLTTVGALVSFLLFL